MPQKLRSFIGTILIICLVLIYALLATTIATLTLATYPWWVHLLDPARHADHQVDGRPGQQEELTGPFRPA
jgi:hypothetical protein